MGDKHVEVKGAGNYMLIINYMPKLQTISGYNTKHKLFNIVLCGFDGQICLSVCVFGGGVFEILDWPFLILWDMRFDFLIFKILRSGNSFRYEVAIL